MERIFNYFINSVASSFKTKIGDYQDGKGGTVSQYYNHWTNKVWFETTAN